MKNRCLLLILLLVTCCCLLPALSHSANSEDLTETIRAAVLRDLTASVSKDAELEGLRVIKGAGMASGSGYTVSNIVMNGYNGRNRIVYTLSLAGRDGDIKTMVVEAYYDVMASVFITSRPLANGTVLSGSDFYEVKQKGSKIPFGALLRREEIEGKMLRANVGQGVILRADCLAAHASIKRGQKVTVLFEGNNVVVSTRGLLRDDTAIGGTARVLCDVSKKEIYGILASPDTVKVKI